MNSVYALLAFAIPLIFNYYIRIHLMHPQRARSLPKETPTRRRKVLRTALRSKMSPGKNCAAACMLIPRISNLHTGPQAPPHRTESEHALIPECHLCPPELLFMSNAAEGAACLFLSVRVL